MDSNSSILVTFVFALGAALVGGALAVQLRQSVVLGYIIAGIAIGPFTPGFVADLPTIDSLANIGIIFLLFAIGVQLSFRDLLRAGRVASAGALTQVILMIGLGYAVGRVLGWQPLESLFFGAVISNSSSTVIGKVLEERGQSDSEHGRIAFAWSSVQDLSTIALVVLLSSMASGGDGVLMGILQGIGKAALFLAVAIPVGVVALPRVFAWIAGFRNREVFVLTVVAVALGTAYGASFFGLSLALGAFVAGIVVGESDLSHQILGEVMPLRDIFAGLFFVSVGMLVDPVFIVQNLPLVLVTLLLIIVLKGALSAFLVRLSRYSARTALLTGVLLGQSAEFSFLLARVGADVGALSISVFTLMLGGAALSVALASPLYRQAVPLAARIERRLTTALSDEETVVPVPDGELRNHIVLCGYGRVGQIIGAALRARDFRFVVIEEDPRIVRQLRSRGIPSLLGNAANPVLLDRANLSRARGLVIAIPDPVAVRQIVDYARSVNPGVNIVARTHTPGERDYLEQRGVHEAVLGEQELALEMTRHILQRSGLDAREVQLIIQGLRRRS